MKWSSVLIALGFSTAAYAGCFNGPYVGIAGGMVANSADMKFFSSGRFISEAIAEDGELESVVNILGDESRCKASEIAAIGELYAGWGCQFASRFYLGVRVGANFSRYDLRQSSAADLRLLSARADDTGTLSDLIRTRLRTVEYTFDIKPGILVSSNTMLFGVLGVAFNKGQMDASSQFTGNLVANGTGIVFLERDLGHIDIHDQKTRGALRLGFGLEQKVSKCLSLNLTYVYTIYRRMEGEFEPFTGATPASHKASFSSRPKRQFFTIGFSYYL